jgi:hypothetical protein
MQVRQVRWPNLLRAGAIGGAALAAIVALPSLLGAGAPPSPPPDVGLATLPSPPVAQAPAGSAAPGTSAAARVPRDGAPRHPRSGRADAEGEGRGGWNRLVAAARKGHLGPRGATPGEGGRRSGRRHGDRRGRSEGAATAVTSPTYYAPSSPPPAASSGAAGPSEFRFEH